MLIEFKNIDLSTNEKKILDYHVEINYICETTNWRESDIEKYKKFWYSTDQPQGFINSIKESLNDDRTVLKKILLKNQMIGYVWMTIIDIADYNLRIAEIQDLFIETTYRNQKIGLKIMNYLENYAQKINVNLMRVGTGAKNSPAINFYKKLGFNYYRIEFEKKIQYP